MRLELPFGTLALEGAWQNQSTYHFVGEVGAAARALHGGRTVGVTVTVTLTSGELAPGSDLAAMVREQERGLADSFPGFRLQDPTPWPHPTLGLVPQLDFVFAPAPDVLVRQRQCYLRWPNAPRFSCLAFACEASSYEAAREPLVAAFQAFAPPTASAP